VALRQRHEILRRCAERHRDALVFLEVQAADAEVRIQLRDDAGAAAGHEEHLPFVVLEPDLDLLRALDRVAGRIGEAGEFVDTLEVLVLVVRPLEGLIDMRAEGGGMLGQPAGLFEDLQALRPHLALEVGVVEEAEEGVGLRALLGLAERLRRAKERFDVARIGVELGHPERLERVEVSFFDQFRGIFRKRQRRQPPAETRPRIVCDLPPHLHDGLEHVERQLLGVHDPPEVMQRRATLPHIFERDVVLPQKLVCFLFRHKNYGWSTAKLDRWGGYSASLFNISS
jgi:hypothetical protein